jgi:hypothetical protein
MCSIVIGRRNMRAVHDKAPAGTRESTCPSRNGMDFCEGKDNVTGYGGSGNRCINDVSVGGYPTSRSCVSECAV